MTLPVREINQWFYENGFEKNKWFSPFDFLRSDTAIRCNIVNEPTEFACKNIIRTSRALVKILSDWRGTRPHITSGYRCLPLNHLVGGVENSYHVYGQAVDLYVPTSELNTLYELLKKHHYFELILYKNFIHIAL